MSALTYRVFVRRRVADATPTDFAQVSASFIPGGYRIASPFKSTVLYVGPPSPRDTVDRVHDFRSHIAAEMIAAFIAPKFPAGEYIVEVESRTNEPDQGGDDETA